MYYLMSKLKIISYNVNGIRAAVTKGFTEWLELEKPDIVCLQETKAQEDQIPVLLFEELGYQTYSFSAQKKGYSGVAILTKKQPDHVEIGIKHPLYDYEGRFIRCDFGDLSIVSVYHPSGSSGDERQSFKMEWLTYFHQYIKELRKTRPQLILAGDYNICHQAIDIHDPIRNASSSGFLPEERAWIDQFIADGFIDTFRFFHPETPHQYSWWSYRQRAREKNLGWRIDYLLASEPLRPHLASAAILSNAFHSDHCPIQLEINI